MKLKFIEEKAMKVVMLVTTLLVFLFVGSILYTIVKNGWGAMNWEMISSLPGGGFYIGKEGGLLNAIVGSLYIVGASTVLGLAVSIPVVFYLNIYLKKNSKRGSFARLAYDVLFGIPSIVYGAFAFTIMIYLGLKTSLAGGIIVITLLIIPIFIRSMDEIARELPQDMLNASYSLGVTKRSKWLSGRSLRVSLQLLCCLSAGRSEMLLRCCSLPGIRIISRLPWDSRQPLCLWPYFFS